LAFFDGTLMVHLTRIYTKTGDDGKTSTATNERIDKSSDLIEAIGAVDEANSAIGMATDFHNDIIDRIQSDLFDLGAELSGAPTIVISEERITYLENVIDDYNEYLEPLHSFVLPTGAMHNARTVVRRAERQVWKIDGLNPNIAKYLNRLSDLLFVMARYHNKGNEKLWVPKN
jgi:cob(I)alamin adenosyltransferase